MGSAAHSTGPEPRASAPTRIDGGTHSNGRVSSRLAAIAQSAGEARRGRDCRLEHASFISLLTLPRTTVKIRCTEWLLADGEASDCVPWSVLDPDSSREHVRGADRGVLCRD